MADWMGVNQMYTLQLHDDLVKRKKVKKKMCKNYATLDIVDDGMYSVCIEFPKALGHQIVVLKKGKNVRVFDPNGKSFMNSGCHSHKTYEYCTQIHGFDPEINDLTSSEMINTSSDIKISKNSGLCLLWCIVFIILETNQRDIKSLYRNIKACKDLIILLNNKVDIGSYAFEKLVVQKFDQAMNQSYRGIRCWNAESMLLMLRPNL